MIKKIALVLGAAGLAAVGIAASASASVKVENAKCDVGVLLPDSKSSVRWETQDRPDLQAALKAQGLKACITNAQGVAQTQRTQADQAMTNGAKVLLLVNLDSGSGAAIANAAKAKGVKTIDYDRLTLKGSSSYYVSFNNVSVGKLQGQGLVKCLTAAGKIGSGKAPVVAERHGSPTDNNATLFANGYNSVLNPLYAAGKYKKAGNQSVPMWDKDKAVTIFQGMFTAAGGNIDGVLAANDTLGNAAITILKQNGKTVPVTGQDASVQGLQNILAGNQCMTVFKDVKKEADAASKLAIALIKGQSPETAGVTTKVHDPTGNRDVPSVLLTPVSVTKANIKTVTDTGEVAVADVCKGYETQCKAAGIQ